MDKKLFRQIPQVGELTASPEFAALCEAWSQAAVVAALRVLIDGARDGVKDGRALPDFTSNDFIACVEAELHAQARLNLRRVVNGTGIIIQDYGDSALN